MKSAIAAIAFAIVFSSCTPTNWTDLHSVEELKAAFNADRGHARIVLILSPT